MPDPWCPDCGTMHFYTGRCPGELVAAEPERHGWRVNVKTPHGLEAYGVLVARTTTGAWRARIVTYPNVLWATPGGRGAMKFVAASPSDAEHQAIEFIREHCRARGFYLRNEVSLVTPGALPVDEVDSPQASPATRIVRFLPVRFGRRSPSEIGGTGNLSETGLFVVTHHPLEVNHRLRLLLDLRDGPVVLAGDVRWANAMPRVGRSPGMGVRLHSPPALYTAWVRGLA